MSKRNSDSNLETPKLTLGETFLKICSESDQALNSTSSDTRLKRNSDAIAISSDSDDENLAKKIFKKEPAFQNDTETHSSNLLKV